VVTLIIAVAGLGLGLVGVTLAILRHLTDGKIGT